MLESIDQQILEKQMKLLEVYEKQQIIIQKIINELANTKSQTLIVNK